MLAGLRALLITGCNVVPSRAFNKVASFQVLFCSSCYVSALPYKVKFCFFAGVLLDSQLLLFAPYLPLLFLCGVHGRML